MELEEHMGQVPSPPWRKEKGRQERRRKGVFSVNLPGMLTRQVQQKTVFIFLHREWLWKKNARLDP